MSWKNWSYTKKGVVIGLVLTFILILIPSYSAPYHNYTLHKHKYEGYNLIIKNCGESPSNDCLTRLCDYYYSYPEAFGDFCRCDKFTGDITSNSCIWSVENNTLWKHYTQSEKPNIFVLLVPNIIDGLEAFGMFGIFGLIILIFPLMISTFIGYIIGKIKSKNKGVK